MSKTMKGTLMTLIAGIAWGLSGACGQYLMGHGFTAIGLTTIRLVFSGAVLLLLAYLADQEKVKAFLTDRSSYIPLLLFAFLGLLMTQLTYLEAIDATNAGTATVLQYLCPIGVLAYSCIKDRVAPTVSEIISMALAIAGTFLIATHGQLNQLAITPKGLAWGLVSAFAYALYIILPIQLIQKWGSMLVIGIGMLIPGLVMIPFTGRRLFHGQYSMDNLMGLVGLVVIGTIFAYTVFLKGTTLIGPVKGSLLAAIEPISAVFFAFAIMNEHFFAIDFIGMAMILLAVLCTATPGRTNSPFSSFRSGYMVITPLGWPMRTLVFPSSGFPSSSYSRLPFKKAATEIELAEVRGHALWHLNTEITRAQTSISSAFTCCPAIST